MELRKSYCKILFAIILGLFCSVNYAKNNPDSIEIIHPKRFAIGTEILMLSNYAFWTSRIESDVFLRMQINKNFAAYGHFCYSSKYDNSNPFPTIFDYSCYGYAERIGAEYQFNHFWILSLGADLFCAQNFENFQIKIPSIYWDNIPQNVNQTKNIFGGNIEISIEEPLPYNLSARVTAKFSYLPTLNNGEFPPAKIPGIGFYNPNSNWNFYPQLFLIYRFGKRVK